MNIKEFNCFYVRGKINKSIETMDKFVDPEENFDYMVLKGWLWGGLTSQGKSQAISLCVCAKKPDAKICEDDITMTHLRGLYKHRVSYFKSADDVPFGIYPSIGQALQECSPEKIGSGEMIPLEYAVLLRAQTSRNRQGYGWEWNWSGGVGDYTEGTLYGETTDFYITHILVD